MYFTVYKTINLKNSEYYIGVHKTDNPNDRYYGSGLRIKRAIKKYGKNNFKKIILFCYDDAEQAFLDETKILDECLCDKKCLNLARGGKGGANFLGKKHTDKTKKKLSQIALNRGDHKKTIEQLQRERNTRLKKNNGYWHSKEALQKMSEKKINKPRSEETKCKISEGRKGKKFTDKQRFNLSMKMKEIYRKKKEINFAAG